MVPISYRHVRCLAGRSASPGGRRWACPADAGAAGGGARLSGCVGVRAVATLRGRAEGKMADSLQDVHVQPPLWRATVPVLLAVLDRVEAMLDRGERELGDRFGAALDRRPAEGML